MEDQVVTDRDKCVFGSGLFDCIRGDIAIIFYYKRGGELIYLIQVLSNGQIKAFFLNLIARGNQFSVLVEE